MGVDSFFLQVSSAGVAGMKLDLRLDIGNRNSIVLLIFFVPVCGISDPNTNTCN